MSRASVLIILILLIVLHQDVWFWDDDTTLIFGFLPIGLAFHIAYTIVVSMFWWAVVSFVSDRDGGIPETEKVNQKKIDQKD